MNTPKYSTRTLCALIALAATAAGIATLKTRDAINAERAAIYRHGYADGATAAYLADGQDTPSGLLKALDSEAAR